MIRLNAVNMRNVDCIEDEKKKAGTFVSIITTDNETYSGKIKEYTADYITILTAKEEDVDIDYSVIKSIRED